jgi:hypothetical protein
MIYIENKKKSEKSILKKYSNAKIIDITSKGNQPWVKLSPFYPHGNIPVPFSENITAMSVEGIWQGLKVFETEGIDASKFRITDMKGLKRTVRKFGTPLGHQKGINSTELLDYLQARKKIYLKTYRWVLDNKVQDVISLLRDEAKKENVVLLDYNTNQENIYTSTKPLSHAFLVKLYLEKKFPEVKKEFETAKQSVETDIFNVKSAQISKDKNRDNLIDTYNVNKIIRLYTKNGYSLKAINKECSLSIEKIKNILISNNITISQSKKKRGILEPTLF